VILLASTPCRWLSLRPLREVEVAHSSYQRSLNIGHMAVRVAPNMADQHHLDDHLGAERLTTPASGNGAVRSSCASLRPRRISTATAMLRCSRSSVSALAGLVIQRTKDVHRFCMALPCHDRLLDHQMPVPEAVQAVGDGGPIADGLGERQSALEIDALHADRIDMRFAARHSRPHAVHAAEPRRGILRYRFFPSSLVIEFLGLGCRSITWPPAWARRGTA
jgi:hypothetical protein